MEQVRKHHREAVSSTEAISRAMDLVDAFLSARPEDPVLQVYKGSLLALKAQATSLPWKKLSHLEQGVRWMDQAANGAAACPPPAEGLPADIEIFMLRGITCAMIPASYGHGRTARQDLQRTLAHPAFDGLERADRALALSWLAVVLYRDGEMAAADHLYGKARATDVRIAEEAWRHK